ncbi:phage holin family protein [Patescibacteria group bacterium]
MFQTLILQILAGISGLWLTTVFVPGVEFTGSIQSLLFAGLILGLVNSVIKPVLKLITLPLRIITFGLFGIVVNMGMIWIVDIVFPELIISGIIPLFWTTVVVWGLSLIIFLFGKGTFPKKL